MKRRLAIAAVAVVGLILTAPVTGIAAGWVFFGPGPEIAAVLGVTPPAVIAALWVAHDVAA